MSQSINNDINSLSPSFRKKFEPRWAEVIKKYPNAHVFECRRSQARQDWLYAQGRTRPGKIVTRTLTSNHFDGNAVDIVFLDDKKNPTRSGPYDDLIEMAKRYGIRNLKPKETCHFEDDGNPFISSTDISMTQDELKLFIEGEIKTNSFLHKILEKQKSITPDKKQALIDAQKGLEMTNEALRKL